MNWIQAKTYRDSVSLSSNSDGVALKKVTESPLRHRGLFRTLGRRLLPLFLPRSLPLIGVDDKDGFDDDAFTGRGIARHRGITESRACAALLPRNLVRKPSGVTTLFILYTTENSINNTKSKDQEGKTKHHITSQKTMWDDNTPSL